MIWTVLKKELREIHRERRLRILLWSYGLILLIMLISSFAEYRRDAEIREHAAEADRAMWLGQGEKNPHDAAHYGMYAFRPVSPLSILDPGVNAFVGTSIFMEAHRRNEGRNAAILDENGAARFGTLSPRFLILTILPLFLVLIGFDAYTRERERETLPMLTVGGVSPRILATGKCLSLVVVSLIVLVPLALSSAVLALILGTNNDSFLSLGLLFLVYTGFAGGFSALILSVSLWAPSSRVSLVALLSLWFVMTVAIPRLTTNLAEERYPYPTHDEFQGRIAEMKAQGIDGHDPYSEAAKAFERETLEKYGVEKLEDLPINFRGLLAQRGEEYESSVYAAQYEAVKEQYRGQLGLFSVASLASPYLTTRFISMAVARTDDPAYWHFSDAAESYRVDFNRVLNMDNAENSTYGDYGYRASTDLWAKIPPFEYEPLPLTEALSRAGSFLGIWGFQLGACLMFLFISAHRRGITRYEVSKP